MAKIKFKINNNIFSKIISLQDYKQTKASKKIVKIKINNHSLWLIGIKHNPTVKESTKNFLLKNYYKFKKTNTQFDLVVEGPKFKKKLSNEVIIKIYRESGILAIKAINDKQRVVSVEPSFDQILLMSKAIKINQKDLAAWYFLSMTVYSLKNSAIKKNTYKKFLKQAITITKLTNTDPSSFYMSISMDLLQQTGLVLIPQEFGQCEFFKFNKNKIKRAINPSLFYTKYNNLSAQINKIRDYFIYGNLIELAKRKNVLAVYGLNHVNCFKK